MNRPEPTPRRRAYVDWQRRERAGDLRALLGLVLLAWLVFLAVPVSAAPVPALHAPTPAPLHEAARLAPAAGRLLLLGEVHDHAGGHAWRLALLDRWLAAPLATSARSIGVLEEGNPLSPRAFDGTVLLPREPRPDPCDAMRRPSGPSQKSSDQTIAPTSANDRATP